jgi:alkylhydroperoxidase/carboxymuconolactone decarboxylase family protein YurZ
MYDAMVEGAFGAPLSRGGLDRATREMTTIAMLCTLGDTSPQITTHARAALRHGVEPAELLALAEHVSVYAGFPRALNALAAISDVLARVGVAPPPLLRRVRLAGQADASTTPAIMAGIARRIPKARYRELPATPHMQTLEQPALVVDALNGFLTAQIAGGGDGAPME